MIIYLIFDGTYYIFFHNEDPLVLPPLISSEMNI